MSTGVDAIGAFLGNLHAMIGHNATAVVIGQPAGDKASCKLCRYERGEISKDEAARALNGKQL